LRTAFRVFGVCFFVSSRRRHTRCYRDWSSDVCSSDLVELDLSSGRGLLLYLKKADAERPSPLGHTVSVRELSLSSKAHNAFRMGVERLAKKDPAGSLVHFQRAVAELPSYYEAYHQMGLAYMRLGQAAQAEQAFQKAI